MHLVLAHLAHFRAAPDFYSGLAAFLLEHRSDIACRSIAEQLAKLFLVVGDAVFFDESYEVGRSVAGERRFGEVWIGRKEILRAGVQVGEVAAAAAGDEDFLADSIRAFEHQNTPATLAGLNGTHQAGRTGSENDDVVFPIHAGMSLAGPERPGIRVAGEGLSGTVKLSSFHERPSVYGSSALRSALPRLGAPHRPPAVTSGCEQIRQVAVLLAAEDAVKALTQA